MKFIRCFFSFILLIVPAISAVQKDVVVIYKIPLDLFVPEDVMYLPVVTFCDQQEVGAGNRHLALRAILAPFVTNLRGGLVAPGGFEGWPAERSKADLLALPAGISAADRERIEASDEAGTIFCCVILDCSVADRAQVVNNAELLRQRAAPAAAALY